MKVSAINIIALKELLQGMEGSKEQALIHALSPETQIIYHNLSRHTWLKIETNIEINKAAGRILFPKHRNGAHEIQRLIAKTSMSERFKILKNGPTLDFVKTSAESIWSQMWDKGEIKIEKLTDISLTMVLTDYPEMIPDQLDMISGYICGILDLIGARHIKETVYKNNPNAWKWCFSWQ
jgi:hypothetical protein